MKPLTYALSERFQLTLFQSEPGVEPILITDRNPRPGRMFLVRYVLGEGGGGESSRPVFRNELTGYDYELKITYPTQVNNLEVLQSIMEAFMYAPMQATLSKALVLVRNQSIASERPIKAIISEELVTKLVEIYEYAW